MALAPSVQRVVTDVDPLRPVRDVLTTTAIVRGSTERQRAMTWMLLTLAGIALLLATVGLYGVSATAAAARSRELAIRAAVGAEPRSLLRLMLWQGLVTAAIGVAIGAVDQPGGDARSRRAAVRSAAARSRHRDRHRRAAAGGDEPRQLHPGAPHARAESGGRAARRVGRGVRLAAATRSRQTS